VAPEKGDHVRKARRFPPDFRREAVELYRSSDRSPEQVAKELGIGTSTLARWHYQLGPEGKQDDQPTGEERSELRRVRRENRRLKGRARDPKKSRGLLRERERDAVSVVMPLVLPAGPEATATWPGPPPATPRLLLRAQGPEGFGVIGITTLHAQSLLSAKRPHIGPGARHINAT
jgi:transposase